MSEFIKRLGQVMSAIWFSCDSIDALPLASLEKPLHPLKFPRPFLLFFDFFWPSLRNGIQRQFPPQEHWFQMVLDTGRTHLNHHVKPASGGSVQECKWSEVPVSLAELMINITGKAKGWNSSGKCLCQNKCHGHGHHGVAVLNSDVWFPPLIPDFVNLCGRRSVG